LLADSNSAATSALTFHESWVITVSVRGPEGVGVRAGVAGAQAASKSVTSSKMFKRFI
jgi:hypothetical protein